jgi:hypothetical protein
VASGESLVPWQRWWETWPCRGWAFGESLSGELPMTDFYICAGWSFRLQYQFAALLLSDFLQTAFFSYAKSPPFSSYYALIILDILVFRQNRVSDLLHSIMQAIISCPHQLQTANLKDLTTRAFPFIRSFLNAWHFYRPIYKGNHGQRQLSPTTHCSATRYRRQYLYISSLNYIMTSLFCSPLISRVIKSRALDLGEC